MGFQDRDYSRSSGGAYGVLQWLWSGTVPLFTAFDIRVQAHASLVVCIVLGLLFGYGPNLYGSQSFVASTMLFAIVLLHEFGHCFACRWVGGDADQIVMHPLGGLALATPPRRPLPSFITSAGGPVVNVVICALCTAFLWAQGHRGLPNPVNFSAPLWFFTGSGISRWVWWANTMSLMLLVFNLLPIYPLDGGRMVQEIAWPFVGFYKSMMFSCVVGMIAAALALAAGLATRSLMLMLIAGFGFVACYRTRQYLVAEGPWAFPDDGDYSYRPEPSQRQSRRRQKRIDTLHRQGQREQAAIDAILAKVSAHGMQSLTWLEKRALRKATENQRKRDRELAAARRKRG